ncbi:FecR domain-containing protein [Patescibacteria group bacterium]|nr:FecR domain-containing protein [Patescibacteria group bacterium]
MKRWLPILIVFLLILGGLWFWSLGSLPEEADARARIVAMEGSVNVISAEGTERVASQDMVLAEGETVMTGADGKATIDWFGSGETRVGESTTVILQRAQTTEGTTQVRMRLEAGRVWSRVLRLLDLGSDVSVETGDVVATVRGTSFDVQKSSGGPTTIWVADSVVEASGATVGGASDGFFIPEGAMADFGTGARTTSTRPISQADRATPWFTRNREADGNFRAQTLERLKTSLAGRTPSGFSRDLTRWSEGLRIRFAGRERRLRLESRYLLRRLLEIRLMAEEGRSGLAYQEFARLDGELRNRLQANAENIQTVRPAVLAAQIMFRDVPPSSAAYRVKQQVEEWLPLVARHSAERLYARLMTIDARLDEASAAVDEAKEEIATQVLVLARQGLVNADRERKEAKDLEPAQTDRIRRVWKALSIRAEALDQRLKALDEPMPSPPAEEVAAPTSTEPIVAPTSTEATPPSVTSTQPVVPTSTPPVAPKPVSLSLTPTALTIGFFERVTYRAIVVYDTGLTRDVSKAARFTASPTGYGALNGNVFSATQLQGSITINASYEEQGMTLTAASALTIVQR